MQPNLTSEYLASQGLSDSIVERFWEKVFIVPYDKGCWLWVGALNSDGYGSLRMGKKDGKAHRVSWLVNCGPIPDGLHVLHHCDVPACVRWDHLWLGTHLDNMRDKEAKGRGHQPIGVNHNKCKLTVEQVLSIREQYQFMKPGHGCVALSLKFGVSFSTISRIVTRQTWNHV